MFENDIQQARNVKVVLCLFEQLTGLKINFLNSDMYCIGQAKDSANAFGEILTCNVGELPTKYLGVLA
jgi:hypothetical protein